MTTHLPIFGAGSQPTDSDGAQLDYIRMPAEMAVYAAPEVPEPDAVADLQPAMKLLEALLQQLGDYQAGARAGSGGVTDLGGLDPANINLINQVLGEGDVSIVVSGESRTLIQESVLTGVWRIQSLDEAGRVVSDAIEVAAIPGVVVSQGFAGAGEGVSFDEADLPEGVMNAPPLLTELNEQIPLIQQNGGSHIINLSLLPQSEQDLQFLQQRLGGGRVMILSRGYGNCRITSTGTTNVWWVQYFNSQDSVILNTLEVSRVPEVACAAAEDIADSAQRLNEILEVYR